MIMHLVNEWDIIKAITVAIMIWIRQHIHYASKFYTRLKKKHIKTAINSVKFLNFVAPYFISYTNVDKYVYNISVYG